MHESIVRALLRMSEEAFLLGILAFFGASLAGLAAHLRSGKELGWRAVTAAVLNSGLVGLIIFLIGFRVFHDDLAYLIGMSLLSGIGGATLLDFALQLVKRGLGIRISIDQPQQRKE